MRFAHVLLLCLLATACNRVDPSSTPAAPVATAAVSKQGPTELSPEQVAIAPLLSDKCNLETVDGIVVADASPVEAKGRQVPVGGWLVDEVGNSLPGKIAVRIQSTTGDGRMWEFPVVQSLERADVQALFGGSPTLANSGFAGVMDLTGFAAGKYLLRLTYQRAGELVVCDNGRALILK